MREQTSTKPEQPVIVPSNALAVTINFSIPLPTGEPSRTASFADSRLWVYAAINAPSAQRRPLSIAVPQIAKSAILGFGCSLTCGKPPAYRQEAATPAYRWVTAF